MYNSVMYIGTYIYHFIQSFCKITLNILMSPVYKATYDKSILID